MTALAENTFNDSVAKRAARLSLVVSLALLGLKLWAFRETGSRAVFSDAMETIVNVVTGALAMIVIDVAHKPADQDHPYGHGKIEFFSAAFEGGLIAFASIMICVEAVYSFTHGQIVQQIGLGLVVTAIGGVTNALLGFYLLRVGRRNRSATLEASGAHVLSDFWTAAGVVIGLVLVHFTKWSWVDPVVALLVGLLLGWTGIQLVRRSVGGLLDAEDRGLLEDLRELVKDRPSGIIQLHHVRVMRSGRFHHIDAHCVVPEFWDVSHAHERTEDFEASLMRRHTHPGELHLHVDPCRRAYCSVCDLADCPIRLHPFLERRDLSFEELINPEEPQQFIVDQSVDQSVGQIVNQSAIRSEPS